MVQDKKIDQLIKLDKEISSLSYIIKALYMGYDVEYYVMNLNVSGKNFIMKSDNVRKDLRKYLKSLRRDMKKKRRDLL